MIAENQVPRGGKLVRSKGRVGIKDKADQTRVIRTEKVITRGKGMAQHYDCRKSSTSWWKVESSHAICRNMAGRADPF